MLSNMVTSLTSAAFSVPSGSCRDFWWTWRAPPQHRTVCRSGWHLPYRHHVNCRTSWNRTQNTYTSGHLHWQSASLDSAVSQFQQGPVHQPSTTPVFWDGCADRCSATERSRGCHVDVFTVPSTPCSQVTSWERSVQPASSRQTHRDRHTLKPKLPLAILHLHFAFNSLRSRGSRCVCSGTVGSNPARCICGTILWPTRGD